MKVLLISDRPLAQRGLTCSLQGIETEVEALTAANAYAAVSPQSHQDDLDLAIFDVDGAGRKWLDCTNAIASTHARTPITLMSPSMNDLDIVRAIEGGAMGYVSKSSSTEDLLREILGLLEWSAHCTRDRLRDAAVIAVPSHAESLIWKAP